MSDKKISALTSAVTPLGGTEVLPIVQSGTTVKVSVDNLTAGKNVTAVNFGAGLAPGTAGDEKYFRAGLYSLYGQRASASQDLSASWNAYIDSVDTSGNGYKYRVTGDLASAYEQNGAHRWYVAPSGTAGTAVSFTQALTIATNANVTVNAGNLVVGTAGKGIDFSANGGDVLSQYDEGTWTISDISGAGLTLTVDHAKYTRVGNLVTVNVYVTYPVTANASNALLSLPSGLSAAKYDIGTAGTSNGAAAYALTVGGTNAMTLRATNLATLTNAALSGADVLISFTYMV